MDQRNLQLKSINERPNYFRDWNIVYFIERAVCKREFRVLKIQAKRLQFYRFS